MIRLALSQRDLALYESVLQELLSPLNHETLSEWGDAVIAALVAFFRADQAIFAVPANSKLEFRAFGMDAETASSVEATLVELNGEGNSTDSYACADLRQLAATFGLAGVEAWNIPLADRLTGGRISQTPFYQEVVFPSGVSHQTVMGMPFGDFMAMAGVAHSSPDEDRFLGQGLDLLRLLLPPFKAGVHMHSRLNRRRRNLSRCLDTIEDPLVVWNLNGQEIHRNPALNKVLEDDPEGPVVLSAMCALGLDLVRRRTSHPKSQSDFPLLEGSREVWTRRGVYQLRGCYLAQEVFVRDPVVLVTVATSPPRLPCASVLMERFDLTSREAEIALLLASGRSNREIAELLDISPHTVRHHAEHIFLKLDVHTRKAVPLRILGKNG